MASPCPCRFLDDETPIGSTTDSSNPSLRDEDSMDESLESKTNNNNQATDKYEDLTNLYPLIRQSDNVPTIRRRFKRPSWATIGKRPPSVLIKKRPAWVTIG